MKCTLKELIPKQYKKLVSKPEKYTIGQRTKALGGLVEFYALHFLCLTGAGRKSLMENPDTPWGCKPFTDDEWDKYINRPKLLGGRDIRIGRKFTNKADYSRYREENPSLDFSLFSATIRGYTWDRNYMDQFAEIPDGMTDDDFYYVHEGHYYTRVISSKTNVLGIDRGLYGDQQYYTLDCLKGIYKKEEKAWSGFGNTLF